MKKILFIASLFMFASPSFAQDEEGDENGTTTGFKKENLYIGGGLNLGGGNGSFTIGVLPEVGYSITKWLDAGISFNVNYQTQRVEDFYGNVFAKYRATTYGTGAFIRIWPLNFLHVTVQPEYNWMTINQIEVTNNQKTTYKSQAESLLIGVGYGSREIGRQLSYLTIMIDLARNINSPYRDQNNHAQPVFRTGMGFYLRPSRK